LQPNELLLTLRQLRSERAELGKHERWVAAVIGRAVLLLDCEHLCPASDTPQVVAQPMVNCLSPIKQDSSSVPGR